MLKTLRIGIGLMLCVISVRILDAQTFGTNAVIRNNYMEVGLSQCGVYGTSAQPPAAWGYHPNTAAGLGFVCDYQRNGWTVASGAGAFNYCGDYFVPGTPVEGWALTFNGVDRINTNTGCTTFNIPGSITRVVDSPTIDTMEWTGAVAGMNVFQRTLLPRDSLYFVTEVVLCNTTASTMTNVYYGRNVDPDNEQPWTGNFTTRNTIVSQPILPATDALVSAMGLANQCYLGLGARDTRARVNYGGFATIPADDLYLGLGRTTAVGSVANGDVANGIGFQLGNLLPGECICLSFVYVLSASMLNSALEATTGISVSADSTDITLSGATILCKGDSVTLTLGGSAAGYNWTWSPATGLSSTTGISVNAAPPVTTTYTVVGTPRGFACGTELVTITVNVDSVVANAGPDRTGCPGEVITIGGGTFPGEVYSWSPTSGITGSTTSVPTTVTFATPGDYTYVLTATDPITGCTDRDTVVVHIDLNPPTSFTATDTVCVGNPANIAFTGSAGATGYVWTVGGPATPGSLSGPGPHSVSWSSPGTYTVSMYALYGICSTLVATENVVVVPAPVPSINPVADQCFDGHSFSFSYSGGTIAGASYTWTFGPDATPPSSSATSPSGVTFAAPGTKWAILSIGHFGCVGLDTVFFNLNPQPDPFYGYSLDSLCVGDPVDITFLGVTAGATSYLWTVDAVAVPPTMSGPGPNTVYWTTPGWKSISLAVVYGACTSAVFVDSIQVFENPIADINPVADQCFDGHSFSFSLGGSVPSGSSLGWAFGPDATPTTSTSATPSGVTFATPGPKYAVVAVSNHGCIDTDTVFFNVNPQPDPSFTISDDTVCAGTPVSLTFTGVTAGATSYLWTLSPTAVPATLTGAGPHSVFWADGGTKYVSLSVVYGACTSIVAIDSLWIWDNPIADIDPVADQCFDGHSFDFSFAGAPWPTATYDWSFGPDATPTTSTATSPTGVTFAAPGTKYVTLTVVNGFCTDVDTAFFNVNPQPDPTFTVADDSLCAGVATSIEFTGVTAGATSYLWTLTPVSTPSSLTGPGPHAVSWSTGGMKDITLTMVYGACTTIVALDSVMVFDNPVADISPVADQCFDGHSFDFSNAGATDPTAAFDWTFGPDATPTGSTAAAPTGVTFATPGIKFAVLTVTQHGCVDSDTLLFNVNPEPPASFTMDSTACVGEAVAITFTGVPAGATSYLWTVSPTSSPASLTGPGPHSVTWSTSGMKYVTLAVVYGPCTTEVFIDSIMVYEVPVADINPVANACFAFGFNSFDFTSAGPYDPTAATFSWTFGPGASPATSTAEFPTGITFLTPGPKVVALTISQNGCTSVLDTVMFEVYPDPAPTIIVNGASPCFDGNSFDYTALPFSTTATYDWDFSPVAVPGTASGYTVPGVHYLDCGPQVVSLTMTENGCATTVIDTTVVFCNPVVDAGLNVSFCEGTGGATLNSTVVGGTSPLYYSWWCAVPPCAIDSMYDDDPQVNPDASQWYYVQVTDFNGCESLVDSVFVTVLPKPEVDAGPDKWLCPSPAPCEIMGVTVSGTPGPFSYQWSPSIGLSNDTIANPCARPDSTTIYTVTVVDLTTGCTSEETTVDTNSTVTVHVVPQPIADAGPDREICEGDTIMLLGIGYGAGPTYNYEWSPFAPPVSLSANNIPNPLAFPNLTSNYVLTVWSNGCPSFGDTVQVQVHTNPTVDGGADRDICQGDSVLLDGSAAGDPTSPFYLFEWWDATTLDDAMAEDPMASPDSTTTYYVQATSQYGCESPIDSVLVTVNPSPIADAGLPITLCLGDSLQLNGTYSYDGTPSGGSSAVLPSWTPATNISDTAIWNPWVWPTSTMFYYLGVQENICSSHDSVLVTVMASPQISLSADTTVFCEGDSVQLTSSGGMGGAAVHWSPGIGLSDSTAGSPMASPPTTTTYTVTYSEGFCSSVDSVTLQVIPMPVMAYMSSQVTGCAPLTVSFLETSVDAIAYVWDFGDGSISNELSPTHTYEQPGTYVVTLTGTNLGGCNASISTIVVEVSDPGTAEFTSDPSFPVQMSIPNTHVQFIDMSQNATSWVWNFGDGGVSDQENPTHTFQVPGEYTVTLTITNEDGCMSQVQHGPFIILMPDIFIPNVFSPNADGVNDEWWPRYTGDQPYFATIHDRWGNLLFQTRNKMESWKGNDLKSQDVPDGVYFYTVKVGDREFAGDVTLVR
jgi:gliding motility-associated-like protein